MRKQKGNIGDLLVTGICILAMTVVMLSYLENVSLLHQKAAVSQLARKYILRMETVGYLLPDDQTALWQELDTMGVTEISLEGTTMHTTAYGMPITLCICGKLEGIYVFEEKRVSTAKN